MSDALILLAPGFEECEALCVYDTLKRGGIKTILCSVGEREVVSSHGVKILCDEVLDNKTLDNEYTLIFLPGGMPGAVNLYKCDLVRKLLVSANERVSLIAAICASPAVVLGPLGLLEGRKATCYPGCESYYPSFDFSTDGVVISGNVITAKSAGYAFDLGLELLKLIKGGDQKKRVKNEIYYKEKEKDDE